MKNAWRSLAAVCVLVIGIYAYTAQLGAWELSGLNAANAPYNQLVQGFRAGQLSLKQDVPPALMQLADPYDPVANALYRAEPYLMNDLSYYKGRLYLYFGITPALILFWPVVALTGHYLFPSQAVAIFCALGFLISMGLLRALWRRYFAEVSVVVVATCTLALGLATGVPVLLSRSDVYEVPISCGYMLTMLALGAIWCALHEPERRGRWLTAASVAYGLAVGARPSLLFGAVILLVPVAQAWRERRRIWALLMAAIGPITLIGLGLMLYNFLRFDSPLEFGIHYQLGGMRNNTRQLFSLRCLWFNLRVCFLEPARWSARSPFVHDITVPPLPPGHVGVQRPFGILSNIPLVWLALAGPLAWRSQSGKAASVLRWFVMAMALLFGICALTVGFYACAAFRYEVDFLPALMLLAVVGILGLERVLADRALWRRAVRWGWGLLLGFSVAFNLLASVEHYAAARNDLGVVLMHSGRLEDAIGCFERTLRLKPDYAEAHGNLGAALVQAGRVSEALGHYEQALRINPDYADAYYNLGVALAQAGRIPEAIEHLEHGLRIKPDDAKAHYNLGTTLWQTGRVQEAVEHWEQALRIAPDYAEAHDNWGAALLQAGRVPEALGHFEQALRINPDYADAHYNLGLALARLGRLPEAIEHYQQTLRIQPDDAEAHSNLGVALARAGRLPEAIGHLEHALRIKPDFADAHNNLGIALEQTGEAREAIGHYEQALRINPDLIQARNKLAWLLATLAPTDGGDPVRAVTLAERACELTNNRVAAYLETLAAAYAATGRFQDAVATAAKAIELARSDGQPQVVSEIEIRLELYRAGGASRTPASATSPHTP